MMLLWCGILIEGAAAAGVEGWTYPIFADVCLYKLLKRVLAACRRCRERLERYLPGVKACLIGVQTTKGVGEVSKGRGGLLRKILIGWWGLAWQERATALAQILKDTLAAGLCDEMVGLRQQTCSWSSLTHSLTEVAK